MPRPHLQTVFLLLSMLALLTLLGYSITTFAPVESRAHATSSFLFPTSAVISLTDDNSTFFISRPAAFGPPLPKDGMDGELYVLAEGQLACDDTPGWDPAAARDLGAPLWPEGEVDDGTDNLLNPALPNTLVRAAAGRGGHADIESLQQSAEIGGKIVLVSRGGCGFLEKVLWTQRRGGVALIVGDYRRPGIGGGGGGLVTMYAKGDTSNVTIPSVFTSHTTAALLTTLLPRPHPTSAASPPPPHPPVAKAVPTLEYRDTVPRPQLVDVDSDSDSDSAIPIPIPIPIPSPSASASPIFYAEPPQRTGLWITLTPTTMTNSPFFDTLLVLVVSPLMTLTVVYALLLIRSRIRRRRWRAPKSLVERLPVRTYQSTLSTPPSPGRSSSRLAQGETTGTRSPAPSPPLRRNTASPPTNVAAGKAFHSRWSGCNECVVCLEEYVDGVSRVMKLPCGHEFHVGCITPWLTTRRRTCPICKGDVVRGVRASTETETSGSGADETTPLVIGIDEEEWERERDLEGAGNARSGG